MNLKNRIKRLETSVPSFDGKCQCPREIVTELILPDTDEADEEYERRIAQTEEAQSCDQCGKEIEVTKIIVEYV